MDKRSRYIEDIGSNLARLSVESLQRLHADVSAAVAEPDSVAGFLADAVGLKESDLDRSGRKAHSGTPFTPDRVPPETVDDDQRQRQHPLTRDSVLQIFSELLQSIERLEEEERTAVIREINQQVQALMRRLRSEGTGTPQPPDKAPALFPGRREADPIKWIEDYYGQYLTHFGASADTLFRPHLKLLDETLVNAATQALKDQRRKEKDEFGKAVTPTLGKIVPTKKAKGDRELQERSLDEIFADRRLAMLLYQRLHQHLRNLRGAQG